MHLQVIWRSDTRLFNLLLPENQIQKILICHLIGTKQSSEPILAYCWLEYWEQVFVKYESKSIDFIRENQFEYVVCKTAAILFRPHCVK